MANKIGETDALCPVCLKTIHADKVEEGDDVFIVKNCPDHGDWKVKIWSGAENYKYLYEFAAVPKTPKKRAVGEIRDCPQECGLCERHLQHSCLVVAEVTNRCNLNCPICFATANGCGYDFHPDMETIRGMFKNIV